MQKELTVLTVENAIASAWSAYTKLEIKQTAEALAVYQHRQFEAVQMATAYNVPRLCALAAQLPFQLPTSQETK